MTILTDTPFHRRCGTLKNPHWSMVMMTEHRSKICSTSPAMVTSRYEWTILERDQKTNEQISKQTEKTRQFNSSKFTACLLIEPLFLNFLYWKMIHIAFKTFTAVTLLIYSRYGLKPYSINQSKYLLYVKFNIMIFIYLGFFLHLG